MKNPCPLSTSVFHTFVYISFYFLLSKTPSELCVWCVQTWEWCPCCGPQPQRANRETSSLSLSCSWSSAWHASRSLSRLYSTTSSSGNELIFFMPSCSSAKWECLQSRSYPLEKPSKKGRSAWPAPIKTTRGFSFFLCACPWSPRAWALLAWNGWSELHEVYPTVWTSWCRAILVQLLAPVTARSYFPFQKRNMSTWLTNQHVWTYLQLMTVHVDMLNQYMYYLVPCRSIPKLLAGGFLTLRAARQICIKLYIYT